MTGLRACTRMIVTIGLISAYRSPKRNQRLLSLIILDIDYFKHYSDHYGHVKGDEAPPASGPDPVASSEPPRGFPCVYWGRRVRLVTA